MVKINWTEFSLQDINNIAEYIAKDSQRYAELFVSNVFTKTSES
jgi:plasmid stabilization system protein ParE